jgi:hypothetical protein
MLVRVALLLGLCPDSWLLDYLENNDMCPEMGLYHVLPDTIVVGFPD